MANNCRDFMDKFCGQNLKTKLKNPHIEDNRNSPCLCYGADTDVCGGAHIMRYGSLTTRLDSDCNWKVSFKKASSLGSGFWPNETSMGRSQPPFLSPSGTLTPGVWGGDVGEEQREPIGKWLAGDGGADSPCWPEGSRCCFGQPKEDITKGTLLETHLSDIDIIHPPLLAYNAIINNCANCAVGG